jgi:DTW domain-containing protein YfiP
VIIRNSLLVSVTVSGTQQIDNQLFILILQHPREKKEPLATATETVALLRHAALVVGLSWANLSHALGWPADPRHWGVLYLGSARPHAFGLGRDVIVVDRNGEPEPDQSAVLRNLEGAVLLDGSWSEAKALWWRNPWLLKLQRLVLDPQHRSHYNRVRREPRREALSTLEAAGLLLARVEERPEIETAMTAALDRIIAETRPRRGRDQRRVSV